MTEAKKKRQYGVAANTPNRIVLPERHVIVLVGGTVDPTNFWEDINLPEDRHDTTHSRGYSQSGENKKDPKYWAAAANGARDTHDDNWYWETNPDFRDKLGILRRHATNMQVFTMHGWTGDNAPRNREIAGAYLCDRLCGGGGEKAYYPAWLKQPVMFHLVGHSHGGNVINEFTRRAASSSSWPALWKIRTVTFLSTPFFKDLHPIDTGAFHKDCIIVNAFNKYDLTQRVVADFNLQQLNGVLTLADYGALAQKIKGLSFDGKLLWALAPGGVKDMDPSFWGVDLQLVMDESYGWALYNGCIELIEKLDEILEDIIAIIDKLHVGVVFPLAIQFVDRMCAGREVVSKGLAQRFHRELDRLRAGMQVAHKALRARLLSRVYPVSAFVQDIHINDFLEPLVTLLEMDKNTFHGPLMNLIHDLLAEQLVVFDNTTHTPAAKLRGTAFASKINNVEVTKYDAYVTRAAAAPYRPQFDSFISRLEGIERRYAASGAQRDLLDLVFTLGAQAPAVREFVGEWLKTAQWVERGIVAVDAAMKADAAMGGSGEAHRFVAVVRRLARAILNLAEVLHERDAGEMEVPVDRTPPVDNMPVGSLDYFMRVSHSVSRSDLWPEVLSLWLEQLLPPRRAQGGSSQGG